MSEKEKPHKKGLAVPHIENPLHHQKIHIEPVPNFPQGPSNIIEILDVAESSERPQSLDYIQHLFSDYVELHGDRVFGDDRSVIGGLAQFDKRTVMVIGQQRGHNSKQRGIHNFGMANPEGVRKTKRLMKHAAQFGFPIMTFIDTPGAAPGIGAEERGIGQAIAETIMTMHKLPVPIIATIIGRGYSGGALFAGGVADKLLMLQYSVFSVISPEGAAAILLRDAELAKVAAKRMRITAQDSLEFGIIDGIIPEPLAGAHTDFPATIKSVHKALSESLTELSNKYEVAQNTWDLQIIADRRAKYRKMGKFTEVEPETEQTT